MSWARIDDRIAFHPKVVAAGNAAFGLWVRLLAYSCAHATDGFVTTDAISTFDPPEGAIDRLIQVRLLDKARGGVRLHDFHDWNPSGAQAKAKQTATIEKRRQAGRVGGRKSGEVRKARTSADLPQDDNEANREANAKQSASPFAWGSSKQTQSPVPSRPVLPPYAPPAGGPPASPGSETPPSESESEPRQIPKALKIPRPRF